MAGMKQKPKRRWLAFSLRTLFVLVAVLSCSCAYAMNWIRQRQEVLATRNVAALESPDWAPAMLYLFGERGYSSIVKVNPDSAADVESIARLFPEARVETAWACGPAADQP
jgi:hypothetical protein